MKGRFVVLEGSDGSGKSTVVEMLKVYLKEGAENFVFTREPGGNSISEKIRNILLDRNNSNLDKRTEALLYAASRSQLVSEVIRPALDQGLNVISDRYTMSSLAYQGYGRDLAVMDIKDINDFATDHLRPDLTIFFKLDPQTALKRKGLSLDRMEEESLDFHRKVAEGYSKILEKTEDRIKILDASQDINQVFEQVVSILKAEKII